jgi:type IV secretion/conjugal transfer VirB4 family ATPase
MAAHNSNCHRARALRAASVGGLDDDAGSPHACHLCAIVDPAGFLSPTYAPMDDSVPRPLFHPHTLLPMIDVLSFGLGGAGALAGHTLLTRWREHRTAPQGLADLLQWGFLVDDGVILQKDGALLAGWSYRGPDIDAATPAELQQLTHHLNDALLPLTDRWMLHVDAVRRPARPYVASVFPNAVTALIDDERRDAYHTEGLHFETEYVLTVTYLPPADAMSRLGQWFVRGADPISLAWSRVLAHFDAALDTLQRRLSSVLSLERLTSEALLSHLHGCLTGLWHPIQRPPHGSYLNALLADQEFVGGFEPRMGAHHLRTIAIHGFPHVSQLEQVIPVSTLPLAYRWSTRILPLGTRTAEQFIKRHQLTWFKKRKGAGAWLREMTSSQLVRDATDALTHHRSGAVRFCFTTQVMVVMDRSATLVEQHAQEIVNTLQDAGFTARVETVNSVDAFLGTLPGHGYPNVRRPLLSTTNIVDFLPVTSVWPGLAENPSSYFPPHSPPLLWARTQGSTPFRFHLHDSDVGHTLVVGRTGAGKSTLVGLITAQFQRYPNANVFVFDVGYSAWTLAQAAGARHYDLAAGNVDALAFQPLAQIHDERERIWAAEWIETLCTLQGVKITPVLRERIEIALALLAQNDSPHRTLSELLIHLQHPDLVAALMPYTTRGSYGTLLDAVDDALLDGRYQVFELRHLMDLDDKILIPTALYLFHRMEQRLDGSPTLLVFEELWAALMRSVFADKIAQWLLTLRKQNAAVLLVAHSVGQLAAVPNRHVLLESCPTRIFLPNPDAVARDTAAQYADLGVNAREIDIIARAVPKRHYYVTSPRGRRLVELGLGPLALSLLATPRGMSAELARQTIHQLIEQYGALWPAEWFRRRGLSQWATRFLTWQSSHSGDSDHAFSSQ